MDAGRPSSIRDRVRVVCLHVTPMSAWRILVGNTRQRDALGGGVVGISSRPWTPIPAVATGLSTILSVSTQRTSLLWHIFLQRHGNAQHHLHEPSAFRKYTDGLPAQHLLAVASRAIFPSIGKKVSRPRARRRRVAELGKEQNLEHAL